jgi:3-hydroxyisobutyrate dehydrogenase-like beta-hydroxyacid dehydrogenase
MAPVMSEPTIITVFGLGEAGSLLAADLAGAGAEVQAYDPADVPTPSRVTRHQVPATAVKGSRLVIAATAASDAQKAIAQAWNEMRRGTVYADLSTAPPGLKMDLADTAALRGLPFADVALMAPVPDKGLATPSLASGPGAEPYAGIIGPLGGSIEVIGERPGDAAARKLLRSVVVKGLTALVIESLEAAEAHGEPDWAWEHIVDLVASADESFLRRLLSGTPHHVDRRLVEMESARTFLAALGVDPTMTSATVESLQRIRDEGMPGAVSAIALEPQTQETNTASS